MHEPQARVRRVVLVEDDASVRGLVRRILKPVLPGAVFVEAGDAAGGRQALAEDMPDLVLLDHYLPDAEGLTLLAWLRERDPDVPIIYLTGANTAEVAVAALKGGASDYVVKSGKAIKALPQAVLNALDQRRLRQAERQALERLRDEAHRDPLTGFWNRRVLEDSQVAAAWGSGPVAVAMIDLDGFKAVNDGLGHSAGDRVLQEVAALLRENIRDTDLLVRYGGDEFVAVLPRMEPDSVENWVARVQESLARACAGGRLPLLLGASVGTAAGAGGLADLIAVADANMYADKRRRRALRGG